MAKRLITTELMEEDKKIEGSLRPQLLRDYIGQEKAKQNLKIYVEAAKKLGKPIDNILFLDDNYNADKTAKSAYP